MPTGPGPSNVGPVPTPPRPASGRTEPGTSRNAPGVAVPGPYRGDDTRRTQPRSPRRLEPSHSDLVVNETSAGGFVIDMTRGVPRAAVIARRNRAGRLEWCLPKGHLEGEETPEEAAVREIAEETGIHGHVLGHVGTIDYWFAGDERRVHKVVHHFLLRAVAGVLTVEHDPDGEAEDVAWIAMSDIGDRLAYPNERRLALLALDLLRGSSPPQEDR